MRPCIKKIKNIAFTLFLIVQTLVVFSQLSQPVKWTYKTNAIKDNIIEIQITATVEKNWHLYSQYNTKGLTQQTVFTYEPSNAYNLVGKTTEPLYVEVTDEYGTDRYFESSIIVFKQKIEVVSSKDFTIAATVDAQACTEGKCVMVGDDFLFKIKGVSRGEKEKNEGEETKVKDENTENIESAENIIVVKESKDTTPKLMKKDDTVHVGSTTQGKPWWIVFLVSFAAGLLALITPCVFPMIPMTISFFMKEERSRKQGLKQAYFFGGSIIFMFAALGLALTLLLGKDAMYIISTHWIPNVIFFIIFMVFAFSFFGLFEITLPASWINKSDQQSDKGGYLGSFFIALTTVLVSFSCTGPILGAALIEMASGSSDSLVFFISMIGFALGFALPFTLLAIFPSMIGRMKSGSWLNTVKIVFGFLEIALGLKFLSMADLSENWRLLDRETYLALWIVTFTLLGFYFLGKLKFKGDSPVESISVYRLFLSLITFSFVVYMIPGLWGAPLKALSGYIPPMTTQDFNIERTIVEYGGNTAKVSTIPIDRKYADILHLPTGFEGFFDLDEAKAYAKKVNKPLFVDFTGKTCANCRKMEESVWINERVKPLLQNEYIMVALYADENTIKLPEEEWVVGDNGKIIKTLGKKNLNYQITQFNINAQPLYVIMDADGNLLTEQTQVFDLSIDNFVRFLEEGIANFKKQK